jgi:hypothetical protein
MTSIVIAVEVHVTEDSPPAIYIQVHSAVEEARAAPSASTTIDGFGTNRYKIG